jgi:hypothetical protein
MVNKQRQQVWLDCDGVLADFIAGFRMLKGMTPEHFEAIYGSSVLWSCIASTDNFFGALPVIEEGRKLYNYLKCYRPIILTGIPRGDWSVPQKLSWRDKHFPGVPMVTCYSRDKRLYCQQGDILIDDTLTYKSLWESAGGTFIHFTGSAEATIAILKDILC